MNNERKDCFWRHLWGKWTDRSEGEVKSQGKVIGKVVIQERRCERCNQIEMRREQVNLSPFMS